jgi:hypothetical protein
MLKAGVPSDKLEGEVLRKYDELQGKYWDEDENGDGKIEFDEIDKRYIEALKKNPSLTIEEFINDRRGLKV